MVANFRVRIQAPPEPSYSTTSAHLSHVPWSISASGHKCIFKCPWVPQWCSIRTSIGAPFNTIYVHTISAAAQPLPYCLQTSISLKTQCLNFLPVATLRPIMLQQNNTVLVSLVCPPSIWLHCRNHSTPHPLLQPWQYPKVKRNLFQGKFLQPVIEYMCVFSPIWWHSHSGLPLKMKIFAGIRAWSTATVTWTRPLSSKLLLMSWWSSQWHMSKIDKIFWRRVGVFLLTYEIHAQLTKCSYRYYTPYILDYHLVCQGCLRMVGFF